MTAKQIGGITSCVAISILLAACGGDDAGGSNIGTVTPTPTPTVTPTPTPTPLSTAELDAITEPFLALDLTSPDGYANQVFPNYYNQALNNLDNTPGNDPIDDAIATVGRVLFYDPALSFNDTTSCATCHQQTFGFDDDQQFSTGFEGNAFTDAHAMRLANIRFYEPGEMFWNRRANSIEDQATQPILNEIEMGWENNGGLAALFTKMEGLDYYPALFTWAFGDDAISQDRVERSLAHFQRAMSSTNSRWDAAYAQIFAPGLPNQGLNETLPGFGASEQRGRELFMTNPNDGGAGCARCHQPPSYSLTANSQSNGLDAGETVIFKSPSLKSVGLSTHFMHDGRFTTLLQVVEHYDSGIQSGPALDNRLTQGPNPLRLNLTADDRQALVDFMLTLTDETLATDSRFADPFR